MKRSLLIVLLLVVCIPTILAQEVRTSQHPVYDNNDRLAVLITYTYDSTGVVETRQLQSFDNQGRLTRTEIYTADEYLLYTEENNYDRHGNRNRSILTTFDEDGHPTRADYRYKYTRQPDGTWLLTSTRLNGETIYTAE